MSTGKYYVYPRLSLFGRRWRWRFRARNGRIIGWGEGYHNKGDAIEACELMRGSASAPIIELSSDKEEMP